MPPAIPDKIACDTEQQLQREINDLRDAIDREETEESWEQILRALARFKAVVRGGAYRHDSFVPSLKPVCRFITTPMLSERGRLLAVAVDLVSTLATALGKRFDPLMQPFALAILKLCQRPNKVVLNRAQGCLTTVIKQTRLSSILPFLRESAKDKSATLRIVSSEAVYLCITTIETDKLANRVSDLEAIIKSTGRDANPEVRKQARAILTEYREKFPERIPTFISPLTPVTRKYLEVQKFADSSAGYAEPLTNKLLAVGKPKLAKETRALEPQHNLPPPSTGGPSRPASTRVHAPDVAQGHATSSAIFPPPRPHSSASMHPPPRPHSSTSMRPKLAHNPITSSAHGQLISRPLSVHVLGHAGFSTATEGDRPRSILAEWNHRLELQRQQSRDNASNVSGTNAAAFPSSVSQTHQGEPESSKSHGEPWLHNRERQRSTSVTNGRVDVNRALGIVQTMNESKLQREERQYDGHDHPPRPPSAASDRPPFMRSRSVRTMRSNGALNAGSGPISATSDTLGQAYPKGIADNHMRPRSPLGPVAAPERPTVVHLHGQTPRAAIERPAVVYLPTKDSDVVAHPRPEKTWSLKHQMELLNKRKKHDDAKVEDAKPAQQTELIGAVVGEAIAPGDVQEPEVHAPVESLSEIVGAVPSNQVLATNGPKSDEALDQSVAFPTLIPQEGNIMLLSSSDPITHVQTGLEIPPSIGESRPRIASLSSKGTHAPAVAKPVVSTTSAPSRARAISASKMPVRAASRSGNTQPTGFVPKRTINSSITQPTKSQAARVQAVMNEKSAGSAKTAMGLTASTSDKSSQASTKRKDPSIKEGLTSNASGFKPTSKTLPSSTTATANPRNREGPRKPPIPTVSSLVKTHAARREAGLATVKIRLGGAPAPTARSTTAPRSKLQATVSSKKVIRSVDAVQAVHTAPTKPDGVSSSIPLSSVLATSDHAVKIEMLRDVVPQAQGTGMTAAEKKQVRSPTSEATLPLPSSSFAIGDEMVGITFKQPAETCAIPVKDGNEGGARLLKELHA